MVDELLSQLPPTAKLAALYGDGAYDTRDCYRAAHGRGAELIVPPRRNGKQWKDKVAWAARRNEALRAIGRFGRKLWKRWSGYHRRSRVETGMHRYKLLGERLSAPARAASGGSALALRHSEHVLPAGHAGDGRARLND